MRLLLDAGADPLRSRYDAIAAAEGEGHYDVSRMMREHVAARGGG